MKFNGLTVTYSDKFLDWQLGEEHEVNPIRALLLTEKLKMLEHYGICTFTSEWDKVSEIEQSKWEKAAARLQPSRVSALRQGDLWEPELFMFGATYFLTEKLLKDRFFESAAGIYFNPAGGELTGQHKDVEVLNDLAWSCVRMTEAGMRVVYLDWDGHHCFETETLLKNTDVLTISIHETSSAATTYSDVDGQGFKNIHMLSGASDYGLINAVAEAIDLIEEQGGADVIVLNAGADGLLEDESTDMQWTLDGFGISAKMLGEFAAQSGASILVGGGGSTLPLDGGAPDVWGAVVGTLSLEMAMIDMTPTQES